MHYIVKVISMINILNKIFNISERRLKLSCLSQDFVTAKNLIKQKANINWQDRKGTSILMACVISDNITAVTFLIKKGADVNLLDNRGFSALVYAAYKKNKTIAKILIESGANTTASNYGTKKWKLVNHLENKKPENIVSNTGKSVDKTVNELYKNIVSDIK